MEPMNEGSTQGQIKTPMADKNVQNKGGEGKVEKFKGTGMPPSAGGADIFGPGNNPSKGYASKWTRSK